MQARGLRIFDEPPMASRPTIRPAPILESIPPLPALSSRPIQRSATIRESVPPPNLPPRPVTFVESEPPAAPVDQIDDRILGVLTSSTEIGETVELAFRRKERQLGELFAVLSVAEAQALHRRLSIASAGDHVAELFNRMTVERRGRLLTFLADARRREVCRR